jgi:hypothetical protein
VDEVPERGGGGGGGAQDRASPNFVGLASLGSEIDISGDFLHSVLLLSAILGLDFLGLALSRPRGDLVAA